MAKISGFAWLPLPSVPLNRFGPLGASAPGIVYVVPIPTAGWVPSGIESIGSIRSILPL